MNRISRAVAAALALALLSVGPAFAQKDFKSAVALADKQITPALLRDYLTFVASDEMEGRDTPSRGLNTVAKFIALNLSRWGLTPMGGDGTYFQKIALARTKLEPEKSSASLGETALKPVVDFMPFPGGGSGTATGGVAYVGHGYFIKAKGIDAYKGVDVKGKILIVHGRLPSGISFRELRGLGKPGEDWMDPLTYAVKSGAVGLVYLAPVATAEDWKAYTDGMMRFSGRFNMKSEDSSPTLPTITVSPDTLGKLLDGDKRGVAEVIQERDSGQYAGAFDLGPVKKLTFTVTAGQETTMTQNVVAVLEGSDPKLKAEYVAIGAHYDHIGMRTSGTGDLINNGADDDGSGTVGLLSIAETLAKSPVRPKRSIIFVWHCGEEKGLWGSGYFVSHPTVPLKQVVAQVNIDMIGRSRMPGNDDPRDKELTGPDGIYVIGSTMMSTDLGTLCRQVNDNYLKLAYDFRYDDPKDPNQFFYRSDHYNYAKSGVPILFFFDGVHRDYHRPSDEVDKIDFVKMAKVARTVLVTVTEIANRPARLTVDKPLDR